LVIKIFGKKKKHFEKKFGIKMKTNIKIFLSVLIYPFIICLFLSCSDQPTAPEDRNLLWTEDIDYFNTQFKSKQLNFSSLISEQAFNNEINSIKSSINSLQDYEIYLKLQQLLASLHVSHITLWPSPQKKLHFLPICPDKFSDGLYIVLADQDNISLLGKKIIKVGNYEISVVADSLKKIISCENEYWANDQLPGVLTLVEALKYFGFTKDLSKVELEVEGAGKVELISVVEPFTDFASGYRSVLEGKKVPLYLHNYSSTYWDVYLKENETFYIAYNKCANATDISFKDFTNSIKDSIESNKVSKVVLDLRNNSGGNSEVIRPLLTYLQNSSFNSEGKLFIVIGNHSFSSAVMDAIYFKQNTASILVGEPTGGKPNGYGEVQSFILPNSELNIQYTVKYFNQVAGDPESLFPDYNIELTSQDFINGRDPVLDFILKY
jgi:hypothetical protein